MNDPVDKDRWPIEGLMDRRGRWRIGDPKEKRYHALVRLLKDRPHAVIQHMLIARRLTGRNRLGIHVTNKTKADLVWFSDKID